MYQTSLLLFRRDLRLSDNLALNAALSQSRQVYPCFILDKRLLDQLSSKLPRVQYLFAALRELDAALQRHGSRLHVVYDHPEAGLARLQQACGATAVFFHRDVTAYAVRRDALLRQYCDDSGLDCQAIDDITLHPPEQTLKPDGTPYTVFTPFFRRASTQPVPEPRTLAEAKLAQLPDSEWALAHALGEAGAAEVEKTSPTVQVQTSLASHLQLQNYEQTRNFPALAGTSRLSAALRFGVLSSREAWWTVAQSLGNEHPLLRQLYWRDFFFSIALFFPRVFSGAFRETFNRIRWPNDPALLAAWHEGLTGFPIVDAGMRELQTTGYMHNRVRMIVASFLVKDLHCDWRLGEKHFAKQLIDYDPCINNGNWQWAASTGCDAQPYFRIFNPWTQQQKFDPDCIYIKRWLPELKSIPPKTLHNLFKMEKALPNYVLPVVDHVQQSKLAKQLFESVRMLK